METVKHFNLIMDLFRIGVAAALLAILSGIAFGIWKFAMGIP